jgi:hypothetical protein
MSNRIKETNYAVLKIKFDTSGFNSHCIGSINEHPLYRHRKGG